MQVQVSRFGFGIEFRFGLVIGLGLELGSQEVWFENLQLYPRALLAGTTACRSAGQP